MSEAANNLSEDKTKTPSREPVETSTDGTVKAPSQEPAIEEDNAKDKEPAEADSSFVKLEFKLVDWSYMDFSRVVSTDTSIQSIKESIKLHHGGNIKRLTLCLDCYQETKELRNDQLSLKEAGIMGGSKNDPTSVIMYYDFTPDSSESGSDPILMC